MAEVNDAQVAAMMESEGFYEKSKGNFGLRFFLFDGTFCLKSDTVPTEEGWESEPVTTMNPKTKVEKQTYVKRFDKIVARIVNVDKRRVEFNDGGKLTNWNFTLMAGNKKASLQCVWLDSFLRKFLKVAPNIDFERPMILSAFKKKKDGKDIQLISIRQGDTNNLDDWQPVPFYWAKPLDENGKVDLSGDAVGQDGSILPDAVHDDEDDSWDFKAQNKFLADHFIKNDLPRIKEIAERLGLNKADDAEGSAPEFSGPPQEAKEIPVVKELPDRCEMTGPNDAMTTEQAKEIRKWAKAVGKDPDALSNKLTDTDFDDLNIEGAAYVTYKLKKRFKKLHESDPEKYPDPDAKSELRKAVEKPKAQPTSDEDDDDWEAAPAPKKSSSSASSKGDDDDEDGDWG